MTVTGLQVRHLGRQPYLETWEAMQAFTAERDENTADELWLLEHPPVYTLGQAGKESHVLMAEDIPVVRSDRGGQVTYHGPGQLVGYLLMDIRRRRLGVRGLVTGIENSIISLLDRYGVSGEARREAPGVYVEGSKVAALGLRIRKGCSYHGFSLNVDMDLRPFEGINPCGYEGLEVTDLHRLGIAADMETVAREMADILVLEFRYDSKP